MRMESGDHSFGERLGLWWYQPDAVAPSCERLVYFCSCLLACAPQFSPRIEKNDSLFSPIDTLPPIKSNG